MKISSTSLRLIGLLLIVASLVCALPECVSRVENVIAMTPPVPAKFDKEIWSDKSRVLERRAMMVWLEGEKRKLIGLSRSSVCEMLGSPHAISPTESNQPVSRKLIFQDNPKYCYYTEGNFWLRIYFDKNDKVQDVQLERLGL